MKKGEKILAQPVKNKSKLVGRHYVAQMGCINMGNVIFLC
jgi:hypothetical protein